jgi:Hypervirulence associated proteins TUDOR domain
MARKYGVGAEVEWTWGGGKGRAKVEEVFTGKVTRTIKGTQVTRNASEDEPAYMLRQDDGARVIKSHSELRKG